jgi:hypothetical protein
VNEVLTTADLGRAPEPELAFDIARRALPFIPAVLGLAGLGWGLAGIASAAYAVALVLANFVLAAVMLSWAGRISLGALMGTALFGYAIRIALIGLAVWVVKDAGWVEPVALGITLIVTHLGLLLWELRFVSASLAYPGLKPAAPTTSLTSKEPAK